VYARGEGEQIENWKSRVIMNLFMEDKMADDIFGRVT